MFARLLVIAVAAMLAGGCVWNKEKRADRHIAAGDRYLADGRYQAAVIEYRNAIKRLPQSSRAYRKLGSAYLAAGNNGEAYDVFTTAADVNPSDVEPRLEAGKLLLAAGMYDVAQVRAEQVLERDPQNVEARILSGRALARLRRFDEALAQLHTAASTSNDAPAYVALGQVRQLAGDSKGAEAAFRLALNGNPQSVEAHVAFAAFLMEAGRVDEAGMQLLEAHATAPNDELANRALASLYLATDRPGNAEVHFKQAADRPAQRYRSSLALGDYYASLGRYDEARAALARISQAESVDGPAAKVRLAALAYVSGEPEEGRRLLERLLKNRPTPEALALEARFLEAEGGEATTESP
jgi:tetratricopeptide (TPR) repeat protein